MNITTAGNAERILNSVRCEATRLNREAKSSGPEEAARFNDLKATYLKFAKDLSIFFTDKELSGVSMRGRSERVGRSRE